MLPALLPFLFAIFWASSYAAAKIGLADISPYLFVAIRLTFAATAALVMVLVLGRPWGPLLRRWPHLMLGGALVHGLALATAHKALVSVAATPTALVHAFHPILTAALGVVLLGERFAWWQWAGFALGLAGVALGVPHDADFGVMALLGLSLFGLSGGTLYLKKFAADVPPFGDRGATYRRRAAGDCARGILRDAARASDAEPGRRDGLERDCHVDRRHGLLQFHDGPLRRRQGGFGLLPGARRIRADRLGPDRRTPQADRGSSGLAASTAGVVLVWWKPIFLKSTAT